MQPILRPQPDTANALGRVVGDTVVSNLPLSSRNYTQIIGLSPGIAQSVTNAAALGNGNGGMTSETEGGGLFVHGARQYDNNFQMDGVQINDLAGLRENLAELLSPTRIQFRNLRYRLANMTRPMDVGPEPMSTS